MSNPSLESLVESAYSAALRTNQTELAAVRINLASSGLNQTTTVADDNSGRPATTLPIPCIRLRAEATSETIGSLNTPKWAVRLEVEVEQKPTSAKATGLRWTTFIASPRGHFTTDRQRSPQRWKRATPRSGCMA